MGPVKNFRVNGIWNKQSLSRTVTWVMLVLLSLANTGLDLPGDSDNNAGGWHNSLWLGTCVVGGELMGECVRLGILRSGAISE
jgi:hypothetical protein